MRRNRRYYGNRNNLKRKWLVVLDTVCDISARVIVNKASFKLKHEEVMKAIHDLSKRVNEDVD